MGPPVTCGKDVGHFGRAYMQITKVHLLQNECTRARTRVVPPTRGSKTLQYSGNKPESSGRTLERRQEAGVFGRVQTEQVPLQLNVFSRFLCTTSSYVACARRAVPHSEGDAF